MLTVIHPSQYNVEEKNITSTLFFSPQIPVATKSRAIFVHYSYYIKLISWIFSFMVKGEKKSDNTKRIMKKKNAYKIMKKETEKVREEKKKR